jgi:hypothetical protein
MHHVPHMLSFVALLVALPAVARPAEPERPRAARRLVGGLPVELVKVTERSITVRGRPPADAKEAPAEQTFDVDGERTKVYVGEVTAERTTEDGRVTRKVTPRPGKLADLKPGQSVRVGAAGGVATRIDIMPPPPAKDDNNGADKKDGDNKK